WCGATGPVALDSRCLAYGLHDASDVYVMINAFWEPVRFHIQQPGAWNRVVDTSRQDLATQAVDGLNYEVAPRSVVVLARAWGGPAREGNGSQDIQERVQLQSGNPTLTWCSGTSTVNDDHRREVDRGRCARSARSCRRHYLR